MRNENGILHNRNEKKPQFYLSFFFFLSARNLGQTMRVKTNEFSKIHHTEQRASTVIMIHKNPNGINNKKQQRYFRAIQITPNFGHT